MGEETVILKKYLQLPVNDQVLVSELIEFLLHKHSITTFSQPPLKRRLGHLKGKIKLSPDFDEPLDDLKEYMQ
ncbi:MAG: DUF2281 domain-containing protein [Saprospiraceae bacterium]|nr:DUF2281 domain-containing protein [Saprospiraceae bacterium]